MAFAILFCDLAPELGFFDPPLSLYSFCMVHSFPLSLQLSKP